MAAGKEVDNWYQQPVSGKPKCQHQHDAKEHQPPESHIHRHTADGEVRAQHFQNEFDQDSANRRCDKTFNTCNHRHRHDQAHLQNHKIIWRNNRDVVCIDRTGQRRHG